jgi:hypothetical protein
MLPVPFVLNLTFEWGSSCANRISMEGFEQSLILQQPWGSTRGSCCPLHHAKHVLWRMMSLTSCRYHLTWNSYNKLQTMRYVCLIPFSLLLCEAFCCLHCYSNKTFSLVRCTHICWGFQNFLSLRGFVSVIQIIWFLCNVHILPCD